MSEGVQLVVLVRLPLNVNDDVWLSENPWVGEGVWVTVERVGLGVSVGGTVGL